jgi:hypothetical protein
LSSTPAQGLYISPISRAQLATASPGQVAASLTAYNAIASYWMTVMLIGNLEDVDGPKDVNANTKLAFNDS